MQAAQSRTQVIISLVARERPTLRQLLHSLAGARGHFTVAGTPEQIADIIEDWFKSGAADGFNVMPPILPALLDDLHRRGRADPAEAGPLPPRICGADAPLALRPGAAGEPVLWAGSQRTDCDYASRLSGAKRNPGAARRRGRKSVSEDAAHISSYLPSFHS